MGSAKSKDKKFITKQPSNASSNFVNLNKSEAEIINKANKDGATDIKKTYSSALLNNADRNLSSSGMVTEKAGDNTVIQS